MQFVLLNINQVKDVSPTRVSLRLRTLTKPQPPTHHEGRQGLDRRVGEGANPVISAFQPHKPMQSRDDEGTASKAAPAHSLITVTSNF